MHTSQRVRCFILTISTDCYHVLSFPVKGKLFAKGEEVGVALGQRSWEALTEPRHRSSNQDSWASELYVKILWCSFLIPLILAHSATTPLASRVFNLLSAPSLALFFFLMIRFYWGELKLLTKKVAYTISLLLVLQNSVGRSSPCCCLHS